MNTYVISLADPRAVLENVGGKGMSLAKMSQAGFPVPEGFHITTTAYRTFVDTNHLQAKIRSALKDATPTLPATLEAASATIHRLFADASTPNEISVAITNAYNDLNRKSVAVRSSATAEDLPDASFAGQQETFLNICGEADLLEALKKCWASLWTARAIGYRIKKGIDQKTVALAVVVQEMVNAEAAGILFTANPINGHRDEMVINASWGLGEAIVSGLVSPDTIIADKATGKVKQYDVAEKTVITVLTEKGTREEKLEDVQSRSRVLNEADVIELVNIARRIESYYSSPQDIEWCHADRRFFIVQSRPITALRTEPDVPVSTIWKLPKGAYVAMRNNIVELMADPLTPLFSTLGLECVNTAMGELLTKFLGKPGILPKEMIVTVNEYAYYNGSVKFLPAMGLILNAVGISKRMFTGAVERWTLEGRPKYLATVGNWQSKDWRQLPDAEILEAVRQLSKAAIEAYGALVSGVIPAAWISEGLFTLVYKFIKQHDDPIASTYLLGFDSLPIQAEKRLYDLASWASKQTKLTDRLAGTPIGQLVAELREKQEPSGVNDPIWQEWRTRFQDALKDYGHMIYNLDFGSPVPADDPAPVLEVFKLFLSGRGVNPHKRQWDATQTRETATQRMMSRLKGFRLNIFQKNLARAQRYAPLREDGLSDVGLSYPLLRQMLLELGHRFSQAGVLESAADIYWLRQDEIEKTIDRMPNAKPEEGLRALIPQRKAVWQAAKRTIPPMMLPQIKVFGFDLTQLKKKRKEAKGSAIKGVPASPGRVTASANVIHGPENFATMKLGDVLVAPLTTPAWTPLFALASAVVTDVGGPLSHGSIVAREYGIPAVLGTGSATRQIISGQTVKVDGDAGVVTLEAINE
jgi:phosphohistidine swiveling domain-containing protein